MNTNSHYGRITAVCLVIFGVLLALSSTGSTAHSPWGPSASLEAFWSPDDGAVQLKWRPYAGASAYQVYRAPLTAEAYEFSLLAEVPSGQTIFSDVPEENASVVYRVNAVGAGNFVYPLAAKLTLANFGGLVPVSLRFHPNTVETALSSLGSYGSVRDANTGERLSGGFQPEAGMVLEVSDYHSRSLTMVGTMPALAAFKFKPNRYRLFAVPLSVERLNLKSLKARGLNGLASHSYVFTDGNNMQIRDTDVYLPGHVYGMRIDRETDIDLVSGLIKQGETVSLPEESRSQLMGSPDDGTQVVVLYDAAYETRLYKCWNNGKSGAWDGITDDAVGADNVKNAAVVRRGCTMYVKDEAGMSDTTPVTVWAPSAPGVARQTVSWNISWDSQKAAAAVQVPTNAPVGDYQVRAGSDPGNYVTVYIIFDPSFALSYLDANEYRSWAYTDDDWQAVLDLKNYLNYSFQGPGYPLDDKNDDVYGYRGDSTAESGADGGVFGQRWVEMAASIHGSGAQTPLEAAIHAYEVIGQRITWVAGNGWYGNDDGEYNTFDDTLKGTIVAPKGGGIADELDVVTAEKAALGLGWTDRLPANYVLNAGACFNFGTCLSTMFRAMGIPGRAQHTMGGDGWSSSFHVWAEAFLDQPEIHPNDPNWWDGYWYEFDCNDPYYATDHTTSHSEGSISPLVICGYGDYLINEYVQCEGIGYDGSFYVNSFNCVPPGRDTGTHTVVPLQNGTTANAEEDNSYPLIVQYDTTLSAWQLMNLFVPYDGPASPSGDPFVYDSHHGYALNSTQTGVSGGSGYIANTTDEDDLPILVDGVDQLGVIGGWGFMMYRIPVNGRTSITVQLTQGADKVEILATLDRNLFSTSRRWDLDYDFRSDASGILTAATAGGDQLYLWFQLSGLDQQNPGLGQEVAWYTVRVGDPLPPSCGDGVCNGDETSATCPQDCGPEPYCGDGICNGDETNATCPGDCPPAPYCGDGICNGDETNATCPGDCPAAPYTITALSGMYVYVTGTTSIGSLRVGTTTNHSTRYWASAVKYELPASPVSSAVIKLVESSTSYCDLSNPGDTMQVSRSAVQFDSIPGYGGIPNQVGSVVNFSVTGCVVDRVTSVNITSVVNEAILAGENTILIRYETLTNDSSLGQHRFYEKPVLEITPQ